MTAFYLWLFHRWYSDNYGKYPEIKFKFIAINLHRIAFASNGRVSSESPEIRWNTSLFFIISSTGTAVTNDMTLHGDVGRARRQKWSQKIKLKVLLWIILNWNWQSKVVVFFSPEVSLWSKSRLHNLMAIERWHGGFWDRLPASCFYDAILSPGGRLNGNHVSLEARAQFVSAPWLHYRLSEWINSLFLLLFPLWRKLGVNLLLERRHKWEGRNSVRRLRNEKVRFLRGLIFQTKDGGNG